MFYYLFHHKVTKFSKNYLLFLESVMFDKSSLIFFVYPGPMGSEENQFTPLPAGRQALGMG